MHMLKSYCYRMNRKPSVILSLTLVNGVPRNYPMLSE